MALAALCLGCRAARIRRFGIAGDEREYLVARARVKKIMIGGVVVVILFTGLSWLLFSFIFSQSSQSGNSQQQAVQVKLYAEVEAHYLKTIARLAY